MSSNTKRILVPTDFTKVADCAINHAAMLAEHMGAEVHLLHIVSDQDDVAEASTKLDMELSRARSTYPKLKASPLVRVGSVYEDIGTSASEIGASLIIMGTHGMRGMQFITGSRALRVITNSKVPFIVVQERNIKEAGYRDIVVPLDLNKETRQKVALVADLAKYFNSRVHILTPREKDEYLQNQLKRNIQFANQYFGERGIEHDSTVAEVDNADFVKGVIRHAVRVNADLIAIVSTLQNSIIGVLGVPNEQEIITNEPMIPVVCMNPSSTSFSDAPAWNV